jgi:hypothetical protein
MTVRLFTLGLLVALAAADGFGQKKKNKKDIEPKTQVLEALPDPPSAVRVESSRLVFLTSPLTTKGLLSQQAKEALSSLRKQAHGATLMKVRAVVAGRGDSRRVAAIVSEQFTEWKLPLPAVSTIQVGALPLEGAQVQLEGIAEDRRPVNPHGVEYQAGKEFLKPLSESGELAPLKPLLEQALGALEGEMLTVTCLVSSLDKVAELEAAITAKFPGVAHLVAQSQRATGSGQAHCEGVSRRTAGDAERLVLTGTLIGFGTEDADVAQVKARLTKLVEAQGAALTVVRGYAVTRGMANKVSPNALVVEGVGSNDATIAVEGIGVVR